MALISAAYSGWRAGYVLGFVLLLIGTQVKVEGVVWLLAACAWMVLAFASRRWLWVLAAALLILAGLVLAIDTIRIPIPGVGQFVWSGNKLYLPFLGWRVLQVNDLREAYFSNAFMLGNWNLVWMMALVASIAAVFGRRRALRPVLSFAMILVASQLVIFVFSTEGAWARDYTAINRLPLQVYPAVIFSLLLMGREFLPGRGDNAWPINSASLVRFGRQYAVSVSLGGLVALLAVLGWLQVNVRDQPLSPPLNIAADQLEFVLGAGERADQGLRITAYQEGLALLSSGPVDLDASRYSLLELKLKVDPDTVYPDESPAFFWRNASGDARVSRITLTGEPVFDLSASPDWQGRIVEVGFVFPDTQRSAPVLGPAWVKTPGLTDQLRLLPRQWLEFEPWTQRSAHVRTGGAESQLVWLPLLVAGLLLAAATFAFFAYQGGPRAPVILALMISGWLLLDLQWLHNRLMQFSISINSLMGQSINERISSSVLGQYHPWLSELNKQLLQDGEDRILIVSDPAQHKYYGLRAKYQLLPHMSVTVRSVPEGRALEKVDYVLFLGTFMPPGRDEDTQVLRERIRALPLERKVLRQIELVEFNEKGMLFKVRDVKQP